MAGVPDYEHELVCAARTHKGSPGVNLLTPVRLPGSDTAILLNRGWVYSRRRRNGRSREVARSRFDVCRLRRRAAVNRRAHRTPNRPSVIARLSYDVVAKALPYPVAPVYVIVLSDSAIAADRIARLSAPPLDEGPHLSYAFQWFAFATVALVGVGVVLRQSRSSAKRRPGLASRPAEVAEEVDRDVRSSNERNEHQRAAESGLPIRRRAARAARGR